MILNLSMCVTVCIGVCTGDRTVQMDSSILFTPFWRDYYFFEEVVRRLSRLSLFIG